MMHFRGGSDTGALGSDDREGGRVGVGRKEQGRQAVLPGLSWACLPPFVSCLV